MKMGFCVIGRSQVGVSGVTHNPKVAGSNPADAKAGSPDRSTRAVVDLLESWIEEDSRLDTGVETWEQLKRALDRSRFGGRRLFPASTRD
jgi:hypothetical protein